MSFRRLVAGFSFLGTLLVSVVALPCAGAVVWMTREEIRALPMSGPAWTAVRAKADKLAVTPDVSNQDDTCDIIVLAKALVYVRTGTESYRTAVRSACMAAINTELGGSTLALARNLPGYVIAADLVGLDAGEDLLFREWLRRALGEVLSDGRSLRQMHETRPNNYGTHAGASRAAVAAYLGDTGELARVATVFRGWLGDRAMYAGFKYGELSWQCDPAKPVGINPPGCTRNGISLDGSLPEEMRRGGPYQWPPIQGSAASYVWEAIQGATVQAEILHRQGYDAWQWQNQALRRMAQFLYDLNRRYSGWWATGDDTWSPWLINHAYGTKFPVTTPTSPGKNMGYADWTHAAGVSLPEDRVAPGTVKDFTNRSAR